MPSYSGVWNLVAVYQAVAQGNWTNPATPIALFAGGNTRQPGESRTTVNVISYVIIPTTGNSQDFGDLNRGLDELAGFASATSGFFCGGYNTSVGVIKDIQKINFSTLGNTTYFRDLLNNTTLSSALSNQTRGVMAAGTVSDSATNVIQYVTMATSGNAQDFGDLTNVAGTGAAACASPTRGVIYASGQLNYTNVINYITIATTGNATDFGDMSFSGEGTFSCSNSTRGLFAGGYGSPRNTIDYVTIASTGNSTDFGDLTLNIAYSGAGSSSTRGVFGGGEPDSGYGVNVIQYVTIGSVGNATDFGDLVNLPARLAGCSNAHGGL